MSEKNNEQLEKIALEFLKTVYKHTPIAVLNQWGMKRYSRFKTRCWKYIESSNSLEGFVNEYFKFYPDNIQPVIIELNKITNKQEIFKYISINLVILIGRLQFELKALKEELENESEQSKIENIENNEQKELKINKETTNENNQSSLFE